MKLPELLVTSSDDPLELAMLQLDDVAVCQHISYPDSIIATSRGEENLRKVRNICPDLLYKNKGVHPKQAIDYQ